MDDEFLLVMKRWMVGFWTEQANKILACDHYEGCSHYTQSSVVLQLEGSLLWVHQNLLRTITLQQKAHHPKADEAGTSKQNKST